MLSKRIIKYIQSLSYKKLRSGQHAFIAEGPKVVEEILSTKKFKCKIICAAADWLVSNKNLLSGIAAENIYETNEASLEKISLLKTPNKVVAVFEINTSDTPVVSGKLSLMLDDIRDPGNLGTIIRIADWFGVDTIICSHNCVDCYNPKVIQATMGSIARVNVYYTSLVDFITSCEPISVYAAALEGEPIKKLGTIKEGIILIGNESAGISTELMALASKKITIPRFGQAESLNAAVAAGIILSQVRSQQSFINKRNDP